LVIAFPNDPNEGCPSLTPDHTYRLSAFEGYIRTLLIELSYWNYRFPRRSEGRFSSGDFWRSSSFCESFCGSLLP